VDPVEVLKKEIEHLKKRLEVYDSKYKNLDLDVLH
jgi:hypothetical protein